MRNMIEPLQAWWTSISHRAQRLFHGDVVVDEEVTRHVQHRQRVGGPDACLAIHLDRQFRGHLAHVGILERGQKGRCKKRVQEREITARQTQPPQTFSSVRSQFSPMILRT